jgi:hypothetical protein
MELTLCIFYTTQEKSIGRSVTKDFFFVANIRLSRTYGDNKILYFVGWVRRGDTFDDKLITFAPRHQRIICNLLYTLPQDARRALKVIAKLIETPIITESPFSLRSWFLISSVLTGRQPR